MSFEQSVTSSFKNVCSPISGKWIWLDWSSLGKIVIKRGSFNKGGFWLGKINGDFAAKLWWNYFTMKLYLIFKWITLTRLLKTWKITLLLLKMLNQTENKN